MYFSNTVLFFSIIFDDALSAAIPVSNQQYSPNKAIFERANPHIDNTAIVKRANPTIGAGIDIKDPQKGGKLVPREGVPISGAFSNAFQMMNYAVTSPGPTNDAVFAKYFAPEDKEVVMHVFKRLLGYDDDDDTGDEDNEGAAVLSNINVIAGEDDPEDPSPAALEGFDEENPNLILSEYVWWAW